MDCYKIIYNNKMVIVLLFNSTRTYIKSYTYGKFNKLIYFSPKHQSNTKNIIVADILTIY